MPSWTVSDRDLQHLIERRAGETAQWRIHWWTPTSMVTLLILGVLGAVSHHLFYTSLDGKEANDQLQKIRYGTALAFFTKMTLAGSIVVGYRQRIWQTFFHVRYLPASLIQIRLVNTHGIDPDSTWLGLPPQITQGVF